MTTITSIARRLAAAAVLGTILLLAVAPVSAEPTRPPAGVDAWAVGHGGRSTVDAWAGSHANPSPQVRVVDAWVAGQTRQADRDDPATAALPLQQPVPSAVIVSGVLAAVLLAAAAASVAAHRRHVPSAH